MSPGMPAFTIVDPDSYALPISVPEKELSKLAIGQEARVRVDSLFLDEGFGTLDDDALDTALETLAGLHRSGKLIGVISHVPAIRERLATRIQVIPGPGGQSTLRGPGVTPT